MNVIARLPKLITLNGTDISARQRREAEDLWLKLMSQRLQGAEKDGRGSQRQALEVLVKTLEDREPRWRSLKSGELQTDCLASCRQQSQCTDLVLSDAHAARGLPSPDGMQAPEKSTSDTIKSNLITLTLRVSSAVPSAPFNPSPSERSVIDFTVLPSLTLKAVRPRILKALRMKPSILNRAKVNRDPSGDSQVRWYGVVRGGSNNDVVVFELDDDMRELAWWGFSRGKETGSAADIEPPPPTDEIWLCLPDPCYLHS
jgi:hypothetical protein